MEKDQLRLDTRGAAKHWLGFLISGSSAFLVDAAVLDLLVRTAGLHPLIARLFAIACAMTAGWLLHRRLTFAVAAPPTATEYGRYVSSAVLTATLNYGLYAALLLLWPTLSHLGALLGATAVTTVCSYVAMRYFVYQHPAVDRAQGAGVTSDDQI